MRAVRSAVRVTAFLVFAFLPAAADAQSGITGVVKDSSGGVLPGVNVEAASDALIEKVKTRHHRRHRACSASSICGLARIS